MKKYLFLALLLFCTTAEDLFSQCNATPVANTPYIKVVPANAAGGYHYKIRTFNNISSWNDLNGSSGYTEASFFPIGWFATSTSNFVTMRNAGATVVQMYALQVIERYKHHLPSPRPNEYEQYKITIQHWLAELATLNMKAMVDIGPFVQVLENTMNPNTGYEILSEFRTRC